MAAEALYRSGRILDSFGDLFGFNNRGDSLQAGETEKEARRYGGLFRRWRYRSSETNDERVYAAERKPMAPTSIDVGQTDVGGFFGDGFDERMQQSIDDPNRPRKPRYEPPPKENSGRSEKPTRGKPEKDGAAQIAAAVARGAAEGILGYEGEGGRHFAGKNLAALAGFGAGVLVFLSASSQHLQSVETGQVSSSSPATSYLLWSIPFVGAYVAYKLYCWYYKI